MSKINYMLLACVILIVAFFYFGRGFYKHELPSPSSSTKDLGSFYESAQKGKLTSNEIFFDGCTPSEKETKLKQGSRFTITNRGDASVRLVLSKTFVYDVAPRSKVDASAVTATSGVVFIYKCGNETAPAGFISILK